VGFLLIATLFDRVRNTLNTQAEKNHPYTIHLTGNDTNLLDDVRNNFLLYEIYQLIDTQDADILLVVGNHTRQQLQKLADQARIS